MYDRLYTNELQPKSYISKSIRLLNRQSFAFLCFDQKMISRKYALFLNRTDDLITRFSKRPRCGNAKALTHTYTARFKRIYLNSRLNYNSDRGQIA